MSNSVVHFELPADDPARAYDFYRDTFGWRVDAMPDMGYAMLGTGPVDENQLPTEPGRINGGMAKRQEPITAPMITIGVDDIDASLGDVEKHGGKTVRGKMAVGEMGFAAYFADTEGNVVGLWQNA